MSQVLIAGGRVVAPARGVDGRLDVLIQDGKVEAVAPGLAGVVGSGVRSSAARAVTDAVSASANAPTKARRRIAIRT